MESVLGSNGRELLEILYALMSLKSLIQGKALKLCTDSKNASAISQKGSATLGLQQQAMEIFQFLLKMSRPLGLLMNMPIP